jgi:hypothetical protein
MASNRRHAIGGNEAHHGEPDGKEGYEQRSDPYWALYLWFHRVLLFS